MVLKLKVFFLAYDALYSIFDYVVYIYAVVTHFEMA